MRGSCVGAAPACVGAAPACVELRGSSVGAAREQCGSSAGTAREQRGSSRARAACKQHGSLASCDITSHEERLLFDRCTRIVCFPNDLALRSWPLSRNSLSGTLAFVQFLLVSLGFLASCEITSHEKRLFSYDFSEFCNKIVNDRIRTACHA